MKGTYKKIINFNPFFISYKEINLGWNIEQNMEYTAKTIKLPEGKYIANCGWAHTKTS